MRSEELLAKILSQLAEKFKNQLILKGGILLRLLNSARSTQDLDYVWIRTKKRTFFAEDVKKALEELDGISVTDIRANSRGVFLEIRDRLSDQKTKVEINMVPSTHLPPKPMSTAALTRPYALKTRVIAVMDPAEAFAHKIAATLERDLVRDLYDLTQLEPLTPFDQKTLEDRLSRLEIGRAKPRRIGLREAASLLRRKSEFLNQKRIETELSGMLPEEQIPGLEYLIRASVSRIVQRLEILAVPPLK